MTYKNYPDVYLPSYVFFQNISRDLEHLRRIFDLLPIGVMATNTEGIIIYYNRAHARLDDLKPQEVLGRPEPEVFGYPDISPGIMRSCQKMGRPILGFMCTYYTHKNKNKPIKGAYWVFPFFDSDKKVIGSLCFTISLNDIGQHVQPRHLTWPDYLPASKSRQSIVGDNPVLLKAVQTAKTKAANSPSAVMISGETGTGKELFARMIHKNSPRAEKPFVPINCAAIPAGLLEGLLFGTTKGSFTGAIDKIGLLEEANGGTVYLDEIDSMPMELQPKLLRVLQEMKIRRLGSAVEKKLDLKIITSIGTPIQEVMVREKMRSDLFYRLAVIVINIPPLRERLDDLDELVNFFIAKYNELLRKKVLSFDGASKKWLKNYNWPGNVRELENLIAGSINMVDNEHILTFDHFPDHYLYMMEIQEIMENGFDYPVSTFETFGGGRLSSAQPIEDHKAAKRPSRKVKSGDQSGEPEKPAPKAAFEPPRTRPDDEAYVSYCRQEKSIIEKHLKGANGKLKITAETLGITRQLLRYKMKKYGLSRYDFIPRVGGRGLLD